MLKVSISPQKDFTFFETGMYKSQIDIQQCLLDFRTGIPPLIL